MHNRTAFILPAEVFRPTGQTLLSLDNAEFVAKVRKLSFALGAYVWVHTISIAWSLTPVPPRVFHFTRMAHHFNVCEAWLCFPTACHRRESNSRRILTKDMFYH